MHWLDALLSSVGLKRKDGEIMEVLEVQDANISTYLDLVATNLETAAMAIRRIAKELRDWAAEAENDG